MSGTYTSRGNLYKPAADGSDNVNVVTDLNNNMDRLDALLGWRPVTAGTMPASAFQGAAMYQTDTGRLYVNQGAGGSAATSYKQVLVEGASFDANISLSSSAGQVAIGGTTSDAAFAVMRGTTAGYLFSGRSLTASANSMFTATVAGLLEWGPGSGVADVNLYRSAANILKTDDSFQVGANLTVSGSSTLDDAIVGGNLLVNGATFRPQLHSPVTLANSAAETAMATVTIPASDAVAGATYQLRVSGNAAVAAATTPTFTFRIRLGGVAGTSLVSITVTARSGMSDGHWDIEGILSCTTAGASATWAAMFKITHNFVTSSSTYTTQGPLTTTATRDSTSAQDFVFTGQWSASSPSNTATARVGVNGRMA